MSFDLSSLNDQTNILGISNLINSSENNLDKTSKMKQIEDDIIQNIYDMDIKSEYNFKDEYEKELQKLANNYNKYSDDIKDLDSVKGYNLDEDDDQFFEKKKEINDYDSNKHNKKKNKKKESIDHETPKNGKHKSKEILDSYDIDNEIQELNHNEDYINYGAKNSKKKS